MKSLSVCVVALCCLTCVQGGWLQYLSLGSTIKEPEPPVAEKEVELPPYEEIRPDNYPRSVDPEAYCSMNTGKNLDSYCRSLRDGAYFDPHNPFCGYIECVQGTAERRVCPSGTWMGTRQAAYLGGKGMCRKAIKELDYFIMEGKCPELTDVKVCDAVKDSMDEGSYYANRVQ